MDENDALNMIMHRLAGFSDQEALGAAAGLLGGGGSPPADPAAAEGSAQNLAHLFPETGLTSEFRVLLQRLVLALESALDWLEEADLFLADSHIEDEWETDGLCERCGLALDENGNCENIDCLKNVLVVEAASVEAYFAAALALAVRRQAAFLDKLFCSRCNYMYKRDDLGLFCPNCCCSFCDGALSDQGQCRDEQCVVRRLKVQC